MSRSYTNAVTLRTFAVLSALCSGMISLRLYSSYLAPGSFGVVVVALQVIAYLPLLDGGFRTALSRTMLANPNASERLRLLRFGQFAYSYISVAGLVLSFSAMALYSATPNARSIEMAPHFFQMLAVAGALSFIVAAQSSVLVGLQAQSLTFLISGVGAWVSVLALWFSLYSGLGIWAFVVSQIAVVLVTWPLAIHFIKSHEPRLRIWIFRYESEFSKYFHSIKGDAWNCFRSQVATMLLYSIDIVLVGLLCRPADAAIYGVLTRIFSIIRSVLQSTGEVAWPIIAQRGIDEQGFSDPLLRVNAWLYGGVMGAISLTLLPFCQWFLGSTWTASPLLLQLMIARYLITGLVIPASYSLFGVGRLSVITRALQRELLVGVALGLILGFKYGVNGICTAFVVATIFGTLYPLMKSYGELVRKSTAKLLFQVWWRASVAYSLSYLTVRFSIGFFESNWQMFIPGTLGLSTAVAAGLWIGLWRNLIGPDFRWQREGLLKRLLIQV